MYIILVYKILIFFYLETMSAPSSAEPLNNIYKSKRANNRQSQHCQSVVERLRDNLEVIKIQKVSVIRKPSKFTQHTQEDKQVSCTWENLQVYATRLLSSKPYYICKLMVLCIFLISSLIQDRKKDEKLAGIGNIIQLVCHILFLLMLLCRAVKWKDESHLWNIFDFLCIIFGFLGYGIDNYEVSRYFKSLRTLKLLFIIKQIQILRKPASDLMNSVAKVGYLLIPAILIIYVYAVVGLYTFSDFQFNKCRSSQNLNKSSNWTVYQNQVFLCGEKTCPFKNGQQLQCLNPIDYRVEPNEKQIVNIDQGYGTLKYSNIFFAVLSTFKQTFITGSSRLILLYKQVLNPIFIEVYFYSYIYLISYIYLNIFYSLIITSQWSNDEEKGQKMEEKDEIKEIQAEKIKQQIDINQFQQNSLCKLRLNSLQIQKKQSQASFNNFVKQQYSYNRSKTDDRLQVMKYPIKLHEPEKIFDCDLRLKKTNYPRITSDLEKQDQPSLAASGKQQPYPISPTLYSYSPQNYKKYEIINNIIVLLCCVNLSLDFQGQNQRFKFIVDSIDFGFYCLLVIQVAFKLWFQWALLRRIQLTTKFDGIISLICTIGVLYEAGTCQNVGDFFAAKHVAQNIFRSFKYLRIMILILRTNIFKEARLILESTFRSLFIIRHMVIVWIVIVILFGVMGFHLHGYKTKVNLKTHKLDLQNGVGFQISFDGIYQSIIYTILTFYNEEWDYIMFQQYLGGGPLVIIWQLISLCVGLLLFSKYFMALLMKQLDNLIDKSMQKQGKNQIQIQSRESSDKQDRGSGKNKILPMDQITKIQNSKKNVLFDSMRLAEFPKKGKQKQMKQSKSPHVITAERKKDSLHQKEQFQCQQKNKDKIKKCVAILQYALQSKVYRIIFNIFLISSCILLTQMHPHLDPTLPQAKVFRVIEIINKSYFLIDLFLNLMVYGLYQEENSYLRKSWINWINILVIIFQIICLPVFTTSVVLFKIQKIKVLRVLFFLEYRYKHDWNMRITFHSFVRLLPKIFTLLFITVLMYSFFALILVKVYKEMFFKCQNSTSNIDISNKLQCLLWGGDWVELRVNVNNLFNSTLHLMYIATMEGWINLLYPMMNLAGKDLNPIRDSNKYISIFVVFFFFFGNLIMLNVFIGLSVSNFKRLKDKATGQSKLTYKQKQWLSVKTQIYKLRPQMLIKKPDNLVRGVAFEIVNHFLYKTFQGIIFCGFLITISFYESNISPEKSRILSILQHVFVFILILQYTIQILAFGIRLQCNKYFAFKTIVVIYATSFIFIEKYALINKKQERIIGSISLSLQFIRYISVVDQIPIVKKLFNTIATVLPQTTNIFIMICSTLFVYAIIGMEMFAFLRPNVELDSFNQNYTNFGSALFALVKYSTWQNPFVQISDASQSLGPNFICTEVLSYDDFLKFGQNGCGNKNLSYPFFLSFHIFYSMILMSTILAVIVDSYIQVKRQQQAPITKLVLQKVKSAWAKIDPEATGYIPYRQFWMFTAKLLQIYMGKQKAHSSISTLFASKQQFLKQMSIPIYQNQSGVLCFQFNEVIEALTRIYMKNNFGTTFTKKTEQMFKQRQSAIINGFKRSFYTSSHVATLIILKSGLRLWKKYATNQSGRMNYKNIIFKFNQEKQEKQEKDKERSILK